MPEKPINNANIETWQQVNNVRKVEKQASKAYLYKALNDENKDSIEELDKKINIVLLKNKAKESE